MSEPRKLKKFLPDRNISTRKESAKHRPVKIASNRHSANENKPVEGQFFGRCFAPAPSSVQCNTPPHTHSALKFKDISIARRCLSGQTPVFPR